MEWLSKSVETLIQEIQSSQDQRVHFDVAVIGSGYGGSVAAARLANAKRADGASISLCLLERGKEYLPGEFPNHVRDLPGHVRVDQYEKQDIYGRPDALFDFRSNPDVNVLVGNALGGGSQINAAVALEADDCVWGSQPWPMEFHRDRRLLSPFYARARRMLGVGEFPDDDRNPRLPKLRALKQLEESYSRWPYAAPKYAFQEVRHYMNGEPIRGIAVPDRPVRRNPQFCRLPLAITFAETESQGGVKQSACISCGDCCTGCNHWAKNTLTMNYLPLACRRGARLFTGAKVLRVLHSQNGPGHWRIEFIRTAHEKEQSAAKPGGNSVPGSATAAVHSIYADIVILAAGTLGSTEILLRSRQSKPKKAHPKDGSAASSVKTDKSLLDLSDCLGRRFSCNGDMIAVGFGQSRPVYPIGVGAEDPDKVRAKPGPMAVGMIDFRRAQNNGCPIVIEDGAIPGALKRVYGEIVTTAAMISQFMENENKQDGETDPLAVSEQLIDRSQVYLMMGLDSASGEMRLGDIPVPGFSTEVKRQGVSIHWPDAAKEPVYEVQKTLMEQVRGLGGIPVMSPMWELLPERLTKVLEGRPPDGKLVTVHPLGGCPMGNDAATGAVDHIGQVFRGTTGSALQEGLFVCDGSIIPSALAVNPLLTITALAERNVELIAERCRLRLEEADVKPLPAPPPPCPPAYRGSDEKIAITLRERLRGVLRDEESGAVVKAFGRRRRSRRNTGHSTEDPVSVGPRANRGTGEHDIVIDLEAPISDLDRFLQHATHATDALHVTRLYVDDDWKLGEGLKPDDPVPTHFTGSFEFLVRQDSNRAQRIYRSLRHWWATRGETSSLLDGREYLKPILSDLLSGEGPYGNDEKGFDISVPQMARLVIRLLRARPKDKPTTSSAEKADTEEKDSLDKFGNDVLAVLRVANQTGEQRKFIYSLAFSGADGVPYTLRGEKSLLYGTVSVYGEKAKEVNNPWRSIARLSVELCRQTPGVGTGEKRVAAGELWFDYVDMARNTHRWPQVLSDTDAPGAFLALGSLGLFFARVLAQTYFWTFHVPYHLAKPPVTRPDTCTLPGQYPPPAAPCPPPANYRKASDSIASRLPPLPWPSTFKELRTPVYHWLPKGAVEDQSPRWATATPDTPACDTARKEAYLLLTRYCGRVDDEQAQMLRRQPVVLIPGFAHSTRVFALDKVAHGITQNLVEYLIERDFDVWLLDPRTSCGLVSSWEQWGLEEVANQDLPAAFKRVRAVRAAEAQSAPPALCVVAHCMGAAMFLIAALGARLKDDPDGRGWVKSVVLSQVGPVAVGSASNRLRGEFVSFIKDQLGRDSVDCRIDEKNPEPLDVIADGLAATYPFRRDVAASHDCNPSAEREFANAVCNRITALYGHNWEHGNLAAETHEDLARILGNANIKTFAQLVHFVQNNRLTDKDGENRFVRYRTIIRHLDFPIAIVQGEGNDVFDPETGRRSYLLLKRIGNYSGHRMQRNVRLLYRLVRDAKIDPKEFERIHDSLRHISQIPRTVEYPQYRLSTAFVDDAFADFGKTMGVIDAQLKKVNAGPEVMSRFARLRDRIQELLNHQEIRNGDCFKEIARFVHLDCIIGKDASVCVYPYIGDFLTSTPRTDWDKVEIPGKQKNFWWYTSPPRIGPILGWTRFEKGALCARIWMMPDDDLQRRDDRAEPAAALCIESTTDGKWAPHDPRIRPRLNMFEVVSWADVNLGAGPHEQQITVRAFGEHALPQIKDDPLEDPHPWDEEDDDERPALNELVPREGPRSQIEHSLGRWEESAEYIRAALDHCAVQLSPGLVAALRRDDRIAFIFGSCRYPATGFLSEIGDQIFRAVQDESGRERNGVCPSALLMLGDQIYYDATAEIFDTEKARAKFEQRYVDAYKNRNFRDLVRRIPTYMGIDDHELLEGWEPAIEHNSDRKNAREWGIEAYKCFQQLHAPHNGVEDITSNGLWYSFCSSGFPFFMMDTRTERKRDVCTPRKETSHLVGQTQLDALKDCLLSAQRDIGARPKFVACSSVLAPVLRTTIEEPARWMGDDSWSGFPATRDELLAFIARNGIENVVFLSGDVHLSVVAKITFKRARSRTGTPLKAYCITASPFYSPYPFINHLPCDFAPGSDFARMPEAIAGYTTYADSWVTCDSFSRVDAVPVSGGWRLEVRAFDRRGNVKALTNLNL